MQHMPLILETPTFEQPKQICGKEIEVLQTLAGSLETGKSEEDLREEMRSAVKAAESESGNGKAKRVAKSRKSSTKKGGAE